VTQPLGENLGNDNKLQSRQTDLTQQRNPKSEREKAH